MSKQTTTNIRSKKAFIIRLSIIIIALLTAAALITVSVVLLNKKEFPYSKDPIARIKLDNGMELLFELYDDKAPLAVGNFVYRANNGYYQQTIIHNYKKTPDEGLFIESGKYFNDTKYELKEKFILEEDMKYNIKKDSNSSDSLLTQKYYLSTYITSSNGRASSEFRICLKESNMTNSSNSIYGVVFGYPYDRQTEDNLDQLSEQISSNQSLNNGNNTPSDYIKIIGIEILTDKDYWKNFNYKKEWTQNQDYFLV